MYEEGVDGDAKEVILGLLGLQGMQYVAHCLQGGTGAGHDVPVQRR